MYYVISLQHTHSKDKFITLWRPNNRGYCFSRSQAGIYENPKEGYHKSDSNIAIPKDQGDKLFIEALYDGKPKMMIPNCKAVREVLKVKQTKRGLVKL